MTTPRDLTPRCTACSIARSGYESIIRPVFKDDEMLMITVAAVLGFLVGELQVVLVEQFAR